MEPEFSSKQISEYADWLVGYLMLITSLSLSEGERKEEKVAAPSINKE
jgi:hypothetical protein